MQTLLLYKAFDYYDRYTAPVSPFYTLRAEVKKVLLIL